MIAICPLSQNECNSNFRRPHGALRTRQREWSGDDYGSLTEKRNSMWGIMAEFIRETNYPNPNVYQETDYPSICISICISFS